MSKYSPPSDDSGDESDDKKPKAKRAKKDPNAPKQPMVRVFDEKNLITKLLNRIAKPLFLFSTQNAYLLYANSVRAAVREENPDLSMGDLVSHGCIRWNPCRTRAYHLILHTITVSDQGDWKPIQVDKCRREGNVAIKSRRSKVGLQKGLSRV